MLQTASKLYMVVNNAPPQFLPHPPDSIETITIILTHNFFDRLTNELGQHCFCERYL